MEWCVLHNLRMDLRKDLTTPVGVMNTLILKMWSIQDRDPKWETEIIPLLKPHLKKNRKIEIASTDTPGLAMHMSIKI